MIQFNGFRFARSQLSLVLAHCAEGYLQKIELYCSNKSISFKYACLGAFALPCFDSSSIALSLSLSFFLHLFASFSLEGSV